MNFASVTFLRNPLRVFCGNSLPAKSSHFPFFFGHWLKSKIAESVLLTPFPRTELVRGTWYICSLHGEGSWLGIHVPVRVSPLFPLD